VNKESDPVICYCAGITRRKIRQAVMMGARTSENPFQLWVKVLGAQLRLQIQKP